MRLTIADFDKLSDSKGLIVNCIIDQLKKLFYQESNPYNFANWVQATLLLDSCVIPCKYNVPEELLNLAEKIVDMAEANNCTIERYQIKDGKKINIENYDYKKKKDAIKSWIQFNRELIRT